MDISKKNLYLALGSISLYYFLLHDISGPLGGLVFFFIGWALPLVFIVFLSLFLSSWQSEKFGLNKKIFFIGFILFAVIFSSTLLNPFLGVFNFSGFSARFLGAN